MNNNPREIYMTILISLIGIVFTTLGILVEEPGLFLLGLAPLMALYPLIVGFSVFSKWVDKGKR